MYLRGRRIWMVHAKVLEVTGAARSVAIPTDLDYVSWRLGGVAHTRHAY